MPSRFYLYPFQTGAILKLKKNHPCGSSLWQVERVGADIGIRCLGCSRFQSLPRQKLEKALKEVVEEDKTVTEMGEQNDER